MTEDKWHPAVFDATKALAFALRGACNCASAPKLSSGMATKSSTSKAYSKTSRCWPGYEPVPGKSEHEEGSCRKKPESRNGGKAVSRETARKKQVARGGKRAVQAKKKSPSATERHSVSKTSRAPAKRSRKTANKKTASQKRS